MKKLIMVSLASVAALAAATGMAHAAEVTVPWGSWVASLVNLGSDNLLLLVTAFLAFIVRQLPASLVAMIKTWQVEQLLGKAIVAGINKTAGAAQGKSMKFDVANDVLAQATQYAINNGPRWLITWVGGVDGIKDKLIARITVDEGVALK